MPLKLSKLTEKSDVEKRVARLEKMETRLLRTERNIYYTLGSIFGTLVFLSAMFIPVLGRFSSLGLTWAGNDPVATASHLFMGMFFISMLVCFYKGFKIDSDLPG
jgi:hypothetical protein